MLEIHQIDFINTSIQRDKFGEFSFSYIRTDNIPHGYTLLGIDPGVNWGATVVNGPEINVLWGHLPGSKLPKGERGHQAYQLAQAIASNLAYPESPCVVEGAAYNKQFGQVGLEEVREGFFLGLKHMPLEVRIVPPATIKKKVLQNGRAQAGDWFPWLNHNASDAISIALYGQYIRSEDEVD